MNDKRSQDTIVLSFSDLLFICKKSKVKILFTTVLFAAIACLIALLKSPSYMAEASFREKSKSQQDMIKSTGLSMILGMQDGQEHAAISLMKSRKLIEQVIEKRNLQMEIKKSVGLRETMQNITDNIWIEGAYLTNSPYPVIKDPSIPFLIRNIEYKDEVPLKLNLLIASIDSFKIFDKDNNVVTLGKFGEPTHGKNYTFTLSPKDFQPKIGDRYRLKLKPVNFIVNEIKNKINIKPDLSDKTLLKLTYKERNRHEASTFLNDLMNVYIEYLKKEQKRVNHEQIGYLRIRQNEAAEELEKMMEQHALALSSNMATIESLFALQQTYTQKLLMIDLELERLKKSQEEGLAYDKSIEATDAGMINQILSELRSHKQLADSIHIALLRQLPNPQDLPNETVLGEYLDEIETIQKNSKEAGMILAALDSHSSLPEDLELLHHPRYYIKDWYLKLNEPKVSNAEKDSFENSKEHFKAYLANMLRLWDVEKKLVYERLTHQQNVLLEFQGIDLNTANQLYVEYSKILHTIEADVLHHQFIIQQLQDPTFEMSSLSSVLTDPVSQNIVVKVSDLILRLKDQMNRSQRELDRIQEDLTQQRHFLQMHVSQMLQLLKLRGTLFKDKILSLQKTQLELIQQKISVLENHLADCIHNRINNFKREKSALEQQQLLLKKEMEKLPSKWAAEKLIDLHLDMNRKMIEEITKLVESKNISANIDITQSEPLDIALAPIHPERPRLLMFAFLGSLLGCTLACGFVLMKAVLKGIPATKDNLNALGHYVIGTLQKGSNEIFDLTVKGNLNVLRCLAAHITANERLSAQSQTLLLQINKGPDYSEDLASLLSTSGFKVLILNIAFEKHSKEANWVGLFHYLEGKTEIVSVTKRKNYDYIASGETSSFSTELLASQRFQELIDKLKKEYNFIIIVSKAPVNSAEIKILNNIPNETIFTISDESIQELDAYINKNSSSIAFLFSNALSN